MWVGSYERKCNRIREGQHKFDGKSVRVRQQTCHGLPGYNINDSAVSIENLNKFGRGQQFNLVEI
jgi:galactose mutarotase-like enzyme